MPGPELDTGPSTAAEKDEISPGCIVAGLGQLGPAAQMGAVPLLRRTEATQMQAINLVLVTAVRLLGEGLEKALQVGSRIKVVAVAQDLGELRGLLRTQPAELALVDVCGSPDLEEVRLLAAEKPEVRLLALGIAERSADVIRCARAGFCGYVPRDVSLCELEPLLAEAMEGRSRCSAEIAVGLMHALFEPGLEAVTTPGNAPLTRRERDVLQLLARGLSNKHIARSLDLSVATVKNHTHNVLTKLQVPSRDEARRLTRANPWIAAPLP